MGEKSIVVPSQLAPVIANTVRSYALSQFPSWRPFAYRFLGKAQLMSVDLFIDKPLDIHCNFSKLQFLGKSATLGSVIEETYDVDMSGLSLSKLKEQSTFSCVGEDGILARSLQPTKFSVYYLYQKGLSSIEQNRSLILMDYNTVVFATRHTLITDLGFRITEKDNYFSTITFFGCNEKFIDNALSELSSMFKQSI